MDRTAHDFNRPVVHKRRTIKNTHDGLHMPEWSSSGHCYCWCRVCWDPSTLKGLCICPDCACGKFHLTLGRVV
jgi:hypothetical protein